MHADVPRLRVPPIRGLAVRRERLLALEPRSGVGGVLAADVYKAGDWVGGQLLAFLNVACCVLLYGLWWSGERLRGRSRFAVK